MYALWVVAYGKAWGFLAGAEGSGVAFAFMYIFGCYSQVRRCTCPFVEDWAQHY